MPQVKSTREIEHRLHALLRGQGAPASLFTPTPDFDIPGWALSMIAAAASFSLLVIITVLCIARSIAERPPSL